MAQGNPKQEAPQTTVDWAIDQIAGTYSNVAEASQKLKLAATHCHLIGGAAVMPNIEGHDIQITVIPINRADCYPLKGSDPPKKGIPKVTLMTIANAAAVEWVETSRVDDGSDPHFAEYHVLGRYKAIDGTYRQIPGDRDNDLRDGSNQIRGKTENDINQLRANLIRSCITKAKLRALRDAFGVSQGMLETELDKPFVVARAVFTGRSEDPQLRRVFGQVIAYQQLAATAALYGGQMPALQLPAMQEEPKRLAARAVDYDAHGEVIDAPAATRPPPVPPPARPAAVPKGSGSTAKPGEPVVEWGNKKGTPLRELSDKDLDWYINNAHESIADPGKAKFRANEEKRLAQYLAEGKRRDDLAAGSPPDDRGPDDDLPT